MLTVRLSLPHEDPASVLRFRQEIALCAGIELTGANREPRPYSLYLFAFDGEVSTDPIGMLEFCFIEHPFVFGGNADPGLLAEVAQLAPTKDVLHVGSLAVTAGRRNSRAVTALCQSFLQCALLVEARGFTAVTAVINQRSLPFQRNIGMTKLENVCSGGDFHFTYYDLAPALQRAEKWSHHRPLFSISPHFETHSTDSEQFRLIRRIAVQINERRNRNDQRPLSLESVSNFPAASALHG